MHIRCDSGVVVGKARNPADTLKTMMGKTTTRESQKSFVRLPIVLQRAFGGKTRPTHPVLREGFRTIVSRNEASRGPSDRTRPAM